MVIVTNGATLATQQQHQLEAVHTRQSAAVDHTLKTE